MAQLLHIYPHKDMFSIILADTKNIETTEGTTAAHLPSQGYVLNHIGRYKEHRDN